MASDWQDAELANRPLREVSTIWTMVLCAHGGPVNSEEDALQRFMDRYHVAVYRYFMTALRNVEAAEELFQEFSLRFVRGDFRRFDPRRGRFRDFIRVALMNLIRDYRRRQFTRPATLEPDAPVTGGVAGGVAGSLGEADESMPEFDDAWRAELLAQCWKELAIQQEQGGQPLHTVLKFRAGGEEPTGAELAATLNGQLQPDTPYSESGARKLLQRARDKFADLLIDEVSRSLDDPSLEEVESDLVALGLLTHCRRALDRRWVMTPGRDMGQSD